MLWVLVVQTVSKVGLRLNFAVTRMTTFLVAMTDEERGDDPVALIRRLPKNCILIFRHYTIPARRQLAGEVVRACRRRGVRCLIAGDIALARQHKADGVHFPEYQLRRLPVRRFMPTGWITTAAAHSQKSIRLVDRLGLTAALLSPVFPSASHPAGRALGILRFATICHRTNVPVIALGGVDAGQLNRLRKAGASGVAGISLFYKQ